jgi:hypothetical protein
MLAGAVPRPLRDVEGKSLDTSVLDEDFEDLRELPGQSPQ